MPAKRYMQKHRALMHELLDVFELEIVPGEVETIEIARKLAEWEWKWQGRRRRR